MKSHGPWQILASQLVYRDPWIEVRRDDVVRPDGRSGRHCRVDLKPGVSVLALDDTRRAYLTQEFHYAVGRETLEAVSGGIEPGEEAWETARRELAEELGLEAAHWTHLGWIDPFTTIVASPTQLFLAEGLRSVPISPEGTEQIARIELDWSEVVSQVLDGRITHGPTCVLVLKTQMLLAARGELPPGRPRAACFSPGSGLSARGM